jgi:hypothetical protein
VPNRWRLDGWDLYKRLAPPPYRQESYSPLQLRALMRGAGLTPIRIFGDELWLPRNLALLRAALLRQPPGTAAGQPRQPAAVAPPRGRSVQALKGIADRLLPRWLYVNVGVVARRER